MKRCELCGTPVKVVGHTTKHYEPIGVVFPQEKQIDDGAYTVNESSINYKMGYNNALKEVKKSNEEEQTLVEATTMDLGETVRTFDARTWAKSFNETLVKLGYQPHDEGLLIGWFANAIMIGYDEACSKFGTKRKPRNEEAYGGGE